MYKRCLFFGISLVFFAAVQTVCATVLTMDTGSSLTDGFAFDDGPGGYVGNPATQGYGDNVSDFNQPNRKVWLSGAWQNTTFCYGCREEGWTPNVRVNFPVTNYSQFYNSGYGDLQGAIGNNTTGTVGINFWGESGREVVLHDVQIASWNYTLFPGAQVKIYPITGTDTSYTKGAAVFTTKLTPGYKGHLDVYLGQTRGTALRLEIIAGQTGGPIGVDNVRFSQSPAPAPDPRTVLDPNKVSGIYAFTLPNVSTGQMISSAHLSFYVNGPMGMGSLDVYGVRTSSDPAILPSDYWAGLYDANAHLIQDAVVTSATTLPATITTKVTLGDSSLRNWLNDCYKAGAVAGDTVFIRVNWQDPTKYTTTYAGWFAPQSGPNPPALSYAVSTIPVEVDPTKNIASPIQHVYPRQFVAELFSWKPKWLAETFTTVNFGPNNMPYIRTCEYDVQRGSAGKNAIVNTMDENGNWIKLNFPYFIKQKYPLWDGTYMEQQEPEARIVFDDEGDAYTLIDAIRSNLGSELLLYSHDNCRTWQVYEIPLEWARMEFRDGHNQLPRPPMIVGAKLLYYYTLYMVQPTKNIDGTLSIPDARLVSNDFMGWGGHSGAGNKTVTIGNLTHIVWGGYTPIPATSAGEVPTYTTTYNHTTGTFTPTVLIGTSGNTILSGSTYISDVHCCPAISADSNGVLHVVLSAHGKRFKYSYSTSPNSTAAWSTPQDIGNSDTAPYDSYGNTTYINAGSYVSLLCDKKNNLHLVYRGATALSTYNHYVPLSYLRKKPGQAWDATHRVLVNHYGPANVVSNYLYAVWYHKMNMDNYGRLFVNYTIYKTCLYKSEHTGGIYSYMTKWPDDPLKPWRDGYSPYGVDSDWWYTAAGYNNQTAHDPVILVSDDQGTSWRVALTKDFAPPTTCAEVKKRGMLSPSDYNTDCTVNFIDFSTLGQGWMSGYDFNTLLIFAQEWLDCTNPQGCN